MAEFPLGEVGEEQALAALLAVIRGDDAEAVRVLDAELTGAERVTLLRYLQRMAAMTDDRSVAPAATAGHPTRTR